MVKQQLPLDEPLASEITSGLIDLAALAQEAGGGAFGALDILAHTMLLRVLTLCQAQRGAILLTENPDPQDRSNMLLPTSAKAFRALALQNVREEETSTLLAKLPSPDGRTKSPGFTGWVIYRLNPGGAGQEATQTPRVDTL